MQAVKTQRNVASNSDFGRQSVDSSFKQEAFLSFRTASEQPLVITMPATRSATAAVPKIENLDIPKKAPGSAGVQKPVSPLPRVPNIYADFQSVTLRACPQAAAQKGAAGAKTDVKKPQAKTSKL